MPPTRSFPAEGGCDCKAVRYRMETGPLFVHCCHCRWCQRESGAAFALNAMIEAERVTELGQQPELVMTPSESGSGQAIARCPHCRVAVWSHYAGAGPAVKFVRVGTLDQPDLLPPDIHIFTASKQPWVVLPEGAPAMAAYYDREACWPAASLARRRALLPLIEAYHAAGSVMGPGPGAGAGTPRPEVAALQHFYAAINRNDLAAVPRDFDPAIVRIEPDGFPTAGTYRGIQAVHDHVKAGRGTWAEGRCEPEGFFAKDDKLVVFLHARVRLKGADEWVGGRFADGFVFRDGKITEYRSFGGRGQALAWAGLQPPQAPGPGVAG
jgi:ketosteroid isomerase-like protein